MPPSCQGAWHPRERDRCLHVEKNIPEEAVQRREIHHWSPPTWILLRDAQKATSSMALFKRSKVTSRSRAPDAGITHWWLEGRGRSGEGCLGWRPWHMKLWPDHPNHPITCWQSLPGHNMAGRLPANRQGAKERSRREGMRLLKRAWLGAWWPLKGTGWSVFMAPAPGAVPLPNLRGNDPERKYLPEGCA